MKRRVARRDPGLLFLQQKVERTPGAPVAPRRPRPRRSVCPVVLEWFVAESRACVRRVTVRSGAIRRAPFGPPGALPLPDAGRGPAADSGA